MSALWQSGELAAALGLAGGSPAVTGISIDTRSLRPGDLFVALNAERDGHDFVAEAFAKGAAAALVSRPLPGAVLRVSDTLTGLNRLAAASRARTAARIVAVTGSVGKTTSKEMLRRCFAAFGHVHAAEASFNNHIGVPLTLARMPAGSDFGIFEIGMNHPGEILPLARLVRPDAAIVTCVDRAHIGLMGSLAAIAAEKASIFMSLRAGGTAVMPEDPVNLPILQAAVPGGAGGIIFGAHAPAARLLSARSTATDCTLHAEIAGTRVCATLAAPGTHMAMNALAVLAAAHALGLDLHRAAAALDGFSPFTGRGARRTMAISGGTITLLDESYNASGASVRAALGVLALQPGRRIAALGDMLELGDAAPSEHLGLRPDLITNADLIFSCGPMMRLLFDSLPPSKQGAHALDAAALAPLLLASLRDGDSLLVKGSYGSRMRDVISRLESPV
jgi:UDP-N-acetylmuramoyl-tripeptide--D-alanyl-D-alanine ligase